MKPHQRSNTKHPRNTVTAPLSRLLALIFGCSWGCARDLPGTNPPEGSFYYPVGVSISADDSHVYVVNSNFDFKFNAGWVSVISVDQFLAGAGRDAVVSQLKTPGLGGVMSFSPDGLTGFLPHRHTRGITILETDGAGNVQCGNPDATAGLNSEEEKTDCDREHMVLSSASDFGGDPASDALNDAYECATLQVDTGGATPQTLVGVSHLSTGRVSLYTWDPASPTALAPFWSVPLRITGGTAAVTEVPQPAGRFMVAGSQVGFDGSSSALFAVDLQKLLSGGELSLEVYSLAADVAGTDIYGIAFNAAGDRAFVANRSPDSISMLDASLYTFERQELDGSVTTVTRPRFSVLDSVSLRGDPSAVVVLQRGALEVVAVAGLQFDAVFFFSVQGDRLVLTGRVDNVGDGPFGLAANSFNGREYLWVTLFGGHGVSVIDTTGSDPRAYQLAATLQNPEIE